MSAERSGKQGPPVAFRDKRLQTELGDRARPGGSLGQVAGRDLERYYNLLRRELATVELTEREALLLCDALNGTLLEPTTFSLLWAEVADAIQSDNLHIKWKIVDEEAFVRRLRGWTPGQTTAVIDAVERFWRAPNESDRLQSVGLVH